MAPSSKAGWRDSWTAYKWDCDDGEIQYHAHGPRDSFVVFEGVNAKADCAIFMKATGGSLEAPPTNNQSEGE